MGSKWEGIEVRHFRDGWLDLVVNRGDLRRFFFVCRSFLNILFYFFAFAPCFKVIVFNTYVVRSL